MCHDRCKTAMKCFISNALINCVIKDNCVMKSAINDVIIRCVMKDIHYQEMMCH